MLVRHLFAALLVVTGVQAAQTDTNQFLQFVRAQAAALRAGDEPPRSESSAAKRSERLRKQLGSAMGLFLLNETPPPFEARILGSLEREGYRVERLVFQTLPGVWMTANAYVPDRPGRLPAILMVHGHWRGAKQDPTVQARCIGAAKLGFFVLVVDAFGAGERALGKALGEYHGDMTAATLLPSGLTLAGVQVYENRRALEHMRSRSEVDPGKIGITGASGGGNQSMYAGALVPEFKAVAPVCSVGNYQAYLGAACCYCELVPGALTFTEEWGVLGLIAPRALMVINASRDSRQFSVEEAAWSLERTRIVYDTSRRANNLRHVTFDSGHDYSRPMREAVYGWMRAHLLDGDWAGPVAEPLVTTEEPESLRIFPGSSRPDDWVTLPKFAAAQARLALEQERPARKSLERRRKALREELLGGFPKPSPLDLHITPGESSRTISFSPEPGLRLQAWQTQGDKKLLILLDLDQGRRAATNSIARAAAASGWSVITLDLRATGDLAWPSDKIGRAPDHTTAQWSLWIGRPLIGQWAWDVRRLLDALEKTDGRLPQHIAIAGTGPSGLVAMVAAALDSRIDACGTSATLATYVADAPYEGQRMGTIIPGILREVGDVADLAALVAPRRVCVQTPVGPQNQRLAPGEAEARFASANRGARLEHTGAPAALLALLAD